MIPNLREAWQQSIRPTLTDLLGAAWFLSTPKGMNHCGNLHNPANAGLRCVATGPGLLKRLPSPTS